MLVNFAVGHCFFFCAAVNGPSPLLEISTEPILWIFFD